MKKKLKKSYWCDEGKGLPIVTIFVRVARYEYGEDWVYAVKLIYKNLLQEKKWEILQSWSIIVHTDTTSFREEYLVCNESCLLSSAGGYIGIFFGISLFDFLFFFEWLVSFIFINVSRKNKWNEKKKISFDIFTHCIVSIMWRWWSREENYCIFVSFYISLPENG